MPPDQPREVMMPVPEHDALTMTHIEALRAVGGQVQMLNTTVAGMAADLKTTREAVIRLEAQDLKATIVANRVEAMGAIDKLRSDHDADIGTLDGKVDTLGHTAARFQGIFLPVAVVASALLTGIAATIGSAILQHH